MVVLGMVLILHIQRMGQRLRESLCQRFILTLCLSVVTIALPINEDAIALAILQERLQVALANVQELVHIPHAQPVVLIFMSVVCLREGLQDDQHPVAVVLNRHYTTVDVVVQDILESFLTLAVVIEDIDMVEAHPQMVLDELTGIAVLLSPDSD